MVEALKTCRAIHTTLVLACAAVWVCVLGFSDTRRHDKAIEQLRYIEGLRSPEMYQAVDRAVYLEHDSTRGIADNFQFEIDEQKKNIQEELVTLLINEFNATMDVEDGETLIHFNWGEPDFYMPIMGVEWFYVVEDFINYDPGGAFLFPYIDLANMRGAIEKQIDGNGEPLVVKEVTIDVPISIANGEIHRENEWEVADKYFAYAKIELYTGDVGSSSFVYFNIPVYARSFPFTDEQWELIISQVCQGNANCTQYSEHRFPELISFRSELEDSESISEAMNIITGKRATIEENQTIPVAGFEVRGSYIGVFTVILVPALLLYLAGMLHHIRIFKPSKDELAKEFPWLAFSSNYVARGMALFSLLIFPPATALAIPLVLDERLWIRVIGFGSIVPCFWVGYVILVQPRCNNKKE